MVVAGRRGAAASRVALADLLIAELTGWAAKRRACALVAAGDALACLAGRAAHAVGLHGWHALFGSAHLGAILGVAEPLALVAHRVPVVAVALLAVREARLGLADEELAADRFALAGGSVADEVCVAARNRAGLRLAKLALEPAAGPEGPAAGARALGVDPVLAGRRVGVIAGGRGRRLLVDVAHRSARDAAADELLALEALAHRFDTAVRARRGALALGSGVVDSDRLLCRQAGAVFLRHVLTGAADDHNDQRETDLNEFREHGFLLPSQG